MLQLKERWGNNMALSDFYLGSSKNKKKSKKSDSKKHEKSESKKEEVMETGPSAKFRKRFGV